MRLSRSLFSVLALLYSSYSPVLAQLRTEYGEQQRIRENTAAQQERIIKQICKYGQFIAPAFGASFLRDVYIVDNARKIFRYTDDTSSGVQYTDGTSQIMISSELTCKTTNILGTQIPFAYLGKLGTRIPCESGKYVCEYSVETLGLYVYKKPRNSSGVSRVFLANKKNLVEVGNSGTYRRCDGYYSSPAEIRACFGK
jgi:hypothetical protein